MKLTKQAFAKQCGTSRPTLNKWISQNKDGIKDFVSGDGIDERIFDFEPWASMRKVQPEEPSRSAADELAQIRSEVEYLRSALDQEKRTVEILTNQLAAKDEQIKALLVINQTQLKALPKPKRTLKEWWTDTFSRDKD